MDLKFFSGSMAWLMAFFLFFFKLKLAFHWSIVLSLAWFCAYFFSFINPHLLKKVSLKNWFFLVHSVFEILVYYFFWSCCFSFFLTFFLGQKSVFSRILLLFLVKSVFSYFFSWNIQNSHLSARPHMYIPKKRTKTHTQ